MYFCSLAQAQHTLKLPGFIKTVYRKAQIEQNLTPHFGERVALRQNAWLGLSAMPDATKRHQTQRINLAPKIRQHILAGWIYGACILCSLAQAQHTLKLPRFI